MKLDSWDGKEEEGKKGRDSDGEMDTSCDILYLNRLHSNISILQRRPHNRHRQKSLVHKYKRQIFLHRHTICYLLHTVAYLTQNATVIRRTVAVCSCTVTE